MSESKQVGSVLFRVVDKRGGLHSVAADWMATDGDVVTFHVVDARGDVGSFHDPIAAMRDEGSTSALYADLTPGEVCVTSIRSRWHALDWLLFGALAVNAVLMARDQLLFVG